MLRARSRVREQSLRRIAHRLGAAAALSLVVLLGLGASSALAGPGVVLREGSTGPPVRVTGGEIGGGLSIRALLRAAGFNSADVNRVEVVSDDGAVLTLRGSELDSSRVTDDGANTRFIRPARSSDNFASAPGTPLEMTLEGGSLLAVEASANPETVKAGQTVSFQARVPDAPPGAQLDYRWTFGDGQSGSGRQVKHRYLTSGNFAAQIKVDAVGGSTAQCSSSCGGVKNLEVEVTGRERRPDQPQGLPQGSGSSSSLGGSATGTGGTGTGTGSGDGSGAAGGSSGGSSKATQPSPRRAERPVPRARVSEDPGLGAGTTVVEGILLADRGRSLRGGLPQAESGGSPKAAKGTPGTVSDPSGVGVGVAFALAIVWLGALQERRHVRLRVA